MMGGLISRLVQWIGLDLLDYEGEMDDETRENGAELWPGKR